jgi:membrane protein
MSGKQPKPRWRRTWRFITDDVWDIEISTLPRLRALGIRMLRVANMVFRGFRKDECALHASSLTFSTLMAIVPILALSLAMARTFGGEELARKKLKSVVEDLTRSFERAPVVAPVVPAAGGTNAVPVRIPGTDITGRQFRESVHEWADAVIDQVSHISIRAIGAIGLILLIWMAVQGLSRAEFAFNKVWGVTSSRATWRKFSDYLTLLVVVPFLAMLASSLHVADLLSPVLNESTALWIRSITATPFLKGITTLLMTTLTFAFFLKFMPNTKVKTGPALIGGGVAAALFLLWLELCAAVQVWLIKYHAIYGSFAILPILLAWVYFSWQILLFGGEVSFAVQNCATYRMETGAVRGNAESRILLALAVLAEAGRAMLGKAETFDASTYAGNRRVPVRFLNEVLRELVDADLLAGVAESQGCYVMLRPPDTVTVRTVVNAVLQSGKPPVELGLDNVEATVADVADRMSRGLDTALQEMTVSDLLAHDGGGEAA